MEKGKELVGVKIRITFVNSIPETAQMIPEGSSVGTLVVSSEKTDRKTT